MKRFLLLPVMLLSLALTGCGTTSVFQGGTSITATIQNPVTRQHQAALEASYNIAAKAVLVYMRQPRCKAGTVTGFTNPCSHWPTVQKMQKANRVAYTAIVRSRSFVDNNQTISAISAYNAAVAALRDYKALASVNGVKVD